MADWSPRKGNVNIGFGTTETDSKTAAYPATDPAGISRAQRAWDLSARLLSRYWFLVVAVWLCAVAVSFVGYSKQKPLWNDELLVRWVDTQSSVWDIWSDLKLGICADPPLAHLVTHGLVSVLGSGATTLRLPSMVGECVTLLFLFLTLRRQIGPLYALLGLALPFCTLLPYYGYEARPYGLMYGCFAVAVYCWAKVGDDRSNRISWNVALGIALTAALACHFYSVFALPAFYLGEWVRSRRRHRISSWTLAAILIATASFGLYWPLIAADHRYSNAFLKKPHLGSLLLVPEMVNESSHRLVIALFVFLALVAIFSVLSFRFTSEIESNDEGRFRELTALALGFLLLPLFAWCADVAVLHTFATRYVLHWLFGVFLALPLFAARVFKSDRSLGLALLVACGLPALAYVGQGAISNVRTPHYNDDFVLLEEALPKLNGDIVVSDPLVFTQIVNYSPALKARCIHIWDRENEFKYTGQDEVSMGYPDLVRMGWFRGREWSDYPNRGGTFLFLTVPDSESDGAGWLRAYIEDADRYGGVVMKVGRYVIVGVKPMDVGHAVP